MKSGKGVRWYAGDTGIHEQHPFAALQVQSVLDLELKIREQLYIGQVKRFQALYQQGPQRIVPPAGVAVSEDQ